MGERASWEATGGAQLLVDVRAGTNFKRMSEQMKPFILFDET